MEVSRRKWTVIQMLWLKLNKSQLNKLNIICLLISCSLPDWPGKSLAPYPHLALVLYAQPGELLVLGVVVLLWWIGYVQCWNKAVVWIGRSDSSLAVFLLFSPPLQNSLYHYRRLQRKHVIPEMNKHKLC